MQRSTFDQTSEILASAERLLIAVPPDASADAFASMLALSLSLEIMGKETRLLCASHVPPELQFLPGSSQVHEMIELTREIVIDVPLGDVKSDHVAWEQYDGGIRVLITPERGKSVGGNISPSVSIGRYPWTAVVTLGTSHLERLGKPFADHAPFFYETPVINIDRGTANEFFGAVNLVQATAGTVSEVVFDLITALDNAAPDTKLVTRDVATALYAGLVAGTRSFRSATTTPRSLMIAAQLLEQDADQQTVTQYLLRMRSLATLRLIGHSLARLKNTDGILWTVVTNADFRESESSPNDIPAALDEIMERAGNSDPAVVVYEREPERYEALAFPGRMSVEDREALASAVSGSLKGKFIHVPLENVKQDSIEQAVRERLLPHFPKD